MRAAIYARCSTDEKRQDVELQLKELRRYCEAYGWSYDEVYEYESGFNGIAPKLTQVLEQIRLKKYNVLLVYTLDRFSRTHPKTTNALLDQVVYQYRCRFISLMEGIDSDNEMVWHVVRPLFTYFANMYSKTLSEKVKRAISAQKARGEYGGGRPPKQLDISRLKAIASQLQANGNGYRKIAATYNQGLPKAKHLSHSLVMRTLQQKPRKNIRETQTPVTSSNIH